MHVRKGFLCSSHSGTMITAVTSRIQSSILAAHCSPSLGPQLFKIPTWNDLRKTWTALANSVPTRNWRCKGWDLLHLLELTLLFLWESLLPFPQFSDSGVIKPTPNICKTGSPPLLFPVTAPCYTMQSSECTTVDTPVWAPYISIANSSVLAPQSLRTSAVQSGGGGGEGCPESTELESQRQARYMI